MRFAVVFSLCIRVCLAQDLPVLLNPMIPGLVDLYRDLHAHPELSHHEARTSAMLAEELRKAGYTVTERVGKYPDGSQAFGVVAVLENGTGPRLLIRADMDALPVTEETGLPYASKVRTKNGEGQETGVMHACGHDVHVSTLIGTARALAALKSQWHGTLMLVGQPSEETVEGAKAMLSDHLYERFGTPSMAISLHDTHEHPAGVVGLTSGPAFSGVTSIDVTLRGIGSHGSRPDTGKDPIVMAAQFINQIQTIVSRQTDPHDTLVITVGQLHAGTKRNIIPDEAKLQITMRSFNEKTREIGLSGIRRAALGVALAAGVPDNLAPVVTVLENEGAQVTYNDPALSAAVKSSLTRSLGAGNVKDDPAMMASEDFGLYGLEGHKIPTVMFMLGAADPARFAAAQSAGKQLPGHHSSRFEPLPEPTLRTGVQALTSTALSLLQ